MTGRYKAYPEYKNSGVEWLGIVPKNWSILSLKRTVDKVTNGIWGDEPDEKNDLIVLRVADFNRNKLSISDDKLTFRSIELKDRPSRLLKKGDLLLEKSGGGDKTLVGCVVLFDKDYAAITSNFVAKMTPQKDFDSSFLRYVFAMLYAGKVNLPSIKQTTGIQNLDSDAYLLERFALPSYEEQQKIAAFLDHQTAKIDTLIAKQEKLIELLKEKRQAVISHAVTKGLNPDAPMKDSGVEWLGQVPAHWVVSKVKDATYRIVDGPHFSPKYQDDGYMFISARNIKIDGWSLGDAKYVSETDFFEFNKKVKPEYGDVLLTKGGTTGIARAVDLKFPFQVWVHVAVLKVNKDKFNPFYLAYALNSKSCYEQSQLYTRGATNNDLGLSRIANIFLVAPNIQEQQAIVSWLDVFCNKLDLLCKKAEYSMNLLTERRTALISAAVTGKIDVRDFVVPPASQEEQA